MNIIALLLIIANGLMTYQGFKNPVFFRQYLFQIDDILIRKEYKRLITAGFLHIHWPHFIFNMLSLYFFSDSVLYTFGPIGFTLIYIGSLIGGNLLALFIHRNHGDYSAVGASGAVSGVVFAFIACYPTETISFLFLPIPISAWIYGIAYIALSIYGIKSQRGNIGHEAHLGGAMCGLVLGSIFRMDLLLDNYWIVLALLIPISIFLVLIVKWPELLFLKTRLPFQKEEKAVTDRDIDIAFNKRKFAEKKELDSLLDKVGKKGIEGLSNAEKERLKELSAKL